MKLFIFLIPLCFYLACQPDITVLERQIEVRFDQFDGDVGIFVMHLKSRQYLAINADTLFPTASLIKIPILLALFNRIEHEKMDYSQELIWHADSVNYTNSEGILCSYENGRKIELSKLISLMIMYSDNHASLWCQSLAGGGKVINNWLSENGFINTKVNSRTPGRQDYWKIYGWGQTTPREMSEMLIKIYENRAVSPAASEEMFRILTNIYWDDEALSSIPPWIQAASKQGAVNRSRSEAVLVCAPHGSYVFTVITKNQKDESWEYANEGFVLIRDISRMIWNYFEPDLNYSPAAGSDLYH